MEQQSKLHFGKNQVEINKSDYIHLGKVALALKQDSTLKIQIVGHTSSEGSAAYNQVLSRKRAKEVMNYLINAGVSTEQMEVSAKGEDNLFKTEKSEEDRKENRRVELRIRK